MRLVTGQKRELRGAQQVLRGMFKKLRATKALNERVGFPVGTQKREEFERGLKIRAFLLLAPLEFWLAHRSPAPLFWLLPRCSLALPSTRRHWPYFNVYCGRPSLNGGNASTWAVVTTTLTIA